MGTIDPELRKDQNISGREAKFQKIQTSRKGKKKRDTKTFITDQMKKEQGKPEKYLKYQSVGRSS